MSQEQSADANYQGVWGQRIGFGNKPALLMVDFMQGYTREGAPCSPRAWSALSPRVPGCWPAPVTTEFWWCIPISATTRGILPTAGSGLKKPR